MYKNRTKFCFVNKELKKKQNYEFKLINFNKYIFNTKKKSIFLFFKPKRTF
jgi:hypothetical protein